MNWKVSVFFESGSTLTRHCFTHQDVLDLIASFDIADITHVDVEIA